MALRSSQQNSLLGPDNNGPRKVEVKLLQGPTIQRTALSEVSNRATLLGGHGATGKLLQDNLRKQQVANKTVKPKVTSTSAAYRATGKENVSKTRKERRSPVEQEEMEVEVEVEEIAKVEQLAVAFSTQRLNVEDIDAGDESNPQLVSQYVNDIYRHLRQLEAASPVSARYLEGQNITGKMRAILIDWLVQVHLRFTLLPETLYLTVAILDHYLQLERLIPRTKLQLVGVTAMFIASKYEEMYCPEISDFAFITDKAYNKGEIRKMEVHILKKLDFSISYPLPLQFLRRNSKAGSVDAAQHTLAKYLMELCLPEYSMCHYKPSLIAGAALCLSIKLLDGMPWTDTLVFYSNYTEEQLMTVVCKMAAIIIKSTTSKQQAVRLKYKTPKQMKISDKPQLKSKLVSRLAERASLN